MVDGQIVGATEGTDSEPGEEIRPTPTLTASFGLQGIEMSGCNRDFAPRNTKWIKVNET